MKGKIINFNPEYEGNRERLSLKDMREIWEDGTTKYTDEELLKLREFIYLISKAALHAYSGKKSKIVELKPITDDEKASDTLHSGEYRRAG